MGPAEKTVNDDDTYDYYSSDDLSMQNDEIAKMNDFYKGKFQLTPDQGYLKNSKSPEDAANPWGKVFFTWLNPIIYRGKNEVITEWQLPRLREKDLARVNTETLNEMWDAEVLRVRTDCKKEDGSIDWDQINMTKLMAKFVSPQMYYSIPLKFVYDILQYISPVVMNLLVRWVSTYHDEKALGNTVSRTTGIGFVVAYAAIGIISSFILQQYFHNQNKVGLRLKTAVMGIVYNKAITTTDYSLAGMMDPDGVQWTDDDEKTPTTLGQVLNIITVDSTKLYMFCTYCHTLWSAPLQIVIGTTLMVIELGWPGLLFIPVVIVMMPLTLLVTKKQTKLIQENMKAKDKRLGKESESINAIKVIKMYGWEIPVIGAINEARTAELKLLRKTNFWVVLSYITWILVPVISIVIVFATIYLTDGTVDAGTAYSTIAVFNLLRFPIAMLPNLINITANVKTSLDRLKVILLCPEFESPRFTLDRQCDNAIELKTEKSTIHLIHADGVPMLKNVAVEDLNYPRGIHVAIVGKVGSGKSSLLGFFTGNQRLMDAETCDLSQLASGERLSMDQLIKTQLSVKNSMSVNGKVAFVPQSAWIVNATLRSNIVMNEPFDMKWYKKVIMACELLTDLKVFVDGDMTEIGEKGINLSGGQRQRIALARAAYRRAEIYLLDDVLSALDAHVGQRIVKRLINGLLKTKTVILVTHAVQYLPMFDRVQFVDDGRLRYSGPFSKELREIDSYNEMIAEVATEEEAPEELIKDLMTEEELDDAIDQFVSVANMDSMASALDGGQSGLPLTGIQSGQSFVMDQTRSLMSMMSMVTGIEEDEANDNTPKVKQMKEDALSEQKVDKQDFKYYLKYSGYHLALLAVVTMVLMAVTQSFGSYWVGYWTEDDQMNVWFGLGIYAAFQVGYVVLYGISQTNILAFASIRASKLIHTELQQKLMFAPQSFFDSTPLGRLENLFSREMNSIDALLPQAMASTSQQLITLSTTLIMICVGLPWFAVPLIPIMLMFYYWQRIFVPASRQMKRIESKSSAPVLSVTGETLQGLSTIRSCAMEEAYLTKAFRVQDHALQSSYALNACYRWLSARVEMISATIVVMSTVVSVVFVDSLSAASVGLATSYALQTGQSMSWTVRQVAELENAGVSIERIRDYVQREAITEPTTRDDGTLPTMVKASWPQQGEIKFNNVWLAYRPELPLILKGLNVTLKPGEKVGVVGRTGAGKSTLFLSLLRMVPIVGGNEAPAHQKGSIAIDGENIDYIPLDVLRQRVSIIPQEPVMFAGTIRYNLDPNNLYNEKEVMECVRKAHLLKFVQTKKEQLNYMLQEGGKNISAGERQLICIGRALLRNSKVLLLDEATSSVDRETDAKIQSTIRDEFKGCTILTIAHRINTILDYDQVIVIDNGVVAEMGNPEQLLKDESSMFHSIASAMEEE